MNFTVRSELTSGIQTRWTSIVEAGQVGLAIPPEFEGPGGGFSPEDFYALALANCFAATFKVIAERSKLAFETLRLEGTLTVDRNEKGQPWMSRFQLKAHLGGAADSERATRVLENTSQSCLILNSVNTEKVFEWVIH